MNQQTLPTNLVQKGDKLNLSCWLCNVTFSVQLTTLSRRRYKDFI